MVVASRPQPVPLPEEVARECAARWCDDAKALHAAPAGRVFRLAIAPHPQSSTAIRARCAAGEALGAWVPQAVAAYIAARGLYQANRV